MNNCTDLLLNHIYQFIDKGKLIAPGSTVVLGLSGGPDSLFLLHLLAPLHKAGTITLIAAHLDHEWRPNSASDVEFCRQATNNLGISLVVAKVSDLSFSVKFNGSQEEIGRRARRLFFEQVAREHNADRIALAHHYDDQQETFFIRILRGASLAGLTGMQAQNGLYVRPLLTTKKSEILQYLDQNAIPYLIDPSNSSPDYLRNRIRHAVLPGFRECDSRFDTTFGNTLAQLQSAQEYLECQTISLFNEMVIHQDERILLDCARFSTTHPYMQHRLLIHWLCLERVPFTPTTRFLQEMVRFLQSPRGGTHTLAPTWSVVKKQGKASIHKVDQPTKN